MSEVCRSGSPLYAANGVTGIRDMGSDLEPVTKDMAVKPLGSDLVSCMCVLCPGKRTHMQETRSDP
jgi:hypothetical protein